MPKVIDITGHRFGKLVALSVAGSNANHATKWLCRCDCGNESVVLSDNLRRGHTTSCGCGRIVHGRFGSSEYKAWCGIVARCTNPKYKEWRYYGGRGITVCPEWLASAKAFLEYMGPRPGPGYSIDRIDTNGNYEPGNVRWADAKTQARNKRTSRYVEFDGVRLTLAEWSEKLGVKFDVLEGRFKYQKHRPAGWVLFGDSYLAAEDADG